MKKHTKLIATRRLRALASVDMTRARGGGVDTSPTVANIVPCVTRASVVPCVGTVVPCPARGTP
jgi:hypothetical protein